MAEKFAHIDHLELVIFVFIYITKLKIGPILYKNQQLIKSNKTRFFKNFSGSLFYWVKEEKSVKKFLGFPNPSIFLILPKYEYFEFKCVKPARFT